MERVIEKLKKEKFLSETQLKKMEALGKVNKDLLKRQWYRVVRGEPGICSEASDIIKKRAEDCDYPLLVSLMFDGMHIMKHLEKDGKGLVNLGESVPLDDNDAPTLATETLVFMVNCINQSWKIPVAYFLIDGLSATHIAGLINQCLVALHDCDVKVVSLNCDEAAANIAAVKSLKIINKINEDDVNSDKEIRYLTLVKHRRKRRKEIKKPM
ncbi:uncharacterized protein LOC125501938 [Athalia rosae]|uniref:uncharacterized protein LOC125501938 n=1 Tax=Athalia rosae TaxID=37344 RepID=UPI002033C172|nr:uncharacterized protein LOC125501938 [Athalia rosae]